MLQVKIPASYLEWALCLLTITFCWWKYGWNMDFMKGVRKALKKVESILFSPSPPIRQEKTEIHELKHLKRTPTTRLNFQKRSQTEDEIVDGKPLFFHQKLETKLQDGESQRDSSPCFVCQHENKVAMSDEIKNCVPLKNCLDCETRDPQNPWYIRRFAYFIFFWRKWCLGYQFHTISLNDMMSDERLNKAVSEAAHAEIEENPDAGSLEHLIKKYKSRAESIIVRMRAQKPSPYWYALYVRIASWIIGKALGRIYPKILVRESQIKLIQKARESGNPILYLPIHRSHIDYVLVSWTLVACNMRSPLVAAGENLNIPVFSLLMKSVGGFFIKRKLDDRDGKKDMLYRRMLQSYMARSLASDNDMEFFIEGGRTRTGKPCHPKGGLLSIVVDTLMTNKVNDILVVPVNFSYDRLVEGDYVREQLGQPKVNESFASAAMGLWNSLQTKYGNARVDFGHPFSMKEFVQGFHIIRSLATPLRLSGDFSINDNGSESEKSSIQRKVSSSICATTDVPLTISPTDQRAIVDGLAKHVIYEGVKCFTMMSTHAVAFILLNKYRNGVSLEVMQKEVSALKNELLERGHDSGFSDDPNEAIEHGATVLGPTLVTLANSVVPVQRTMKPVTTLPSVIELSYYSNCILPIFAIEAAIATSVLVLLREVQDNSTRFQVRKKDLISTSLELCELLHYEFILTPPCKNLYETVTDTVEFMGRQKDFEIPLVTSGEEVIIADTSYKNGRLEFLKNLLRPILDSYISSSHVLKKLVGCEAQEKHLQMDMLAEIKTQIESCSIPYGESLALDPIRNFINLVLRWEVLQISRSAPLTTYHLHATFDNHAAVTDVIARFEKFRV